MNAKIALTKLEFMILIEHKFREKQAIIKNLVKKKQHTVCKQNKVLLSFSIIIMQVLFVTGNVSLGEKMDEFAYQHKKHVNIWATI